MSKAFAVDREKRNKRRRAPRTRERHYLLGDEEGHQAALSKETITSEERAEAGMIVTEMARAFNATVRFYKAPEGGALAHDEAVRAAESLQAQRREDMAEGMPAEQVGWGDLSAVAEESMERAVQIWARIRETAANELESGTRAAEVVGSMSPYARAQFLAVRDTFADQWQPQGGIESGLIDLLAIAYSLQMYWAAIAHERAINKHDEQRKSVKEYESFGWKSPYQSEADAIEQAHRLADSYNRQFLRVLRQLRDLRRYHVPVTINNPQQVNIAADGGQQVNMQQTKKP